MAYTPEVGRINVDLNNNSNIPWFGEFVTSYLPEIFTSAFKNTEAYAGKTVSVGGWVRSVRASKAFGFIVLSDGTYFQPLQVVYHDKDDEVTRYIPLLSHEYMMPPVGALVAVAHLTNGSEAGVVFWRPWSDKNVPPEGYEGLYRKDFDLEPWKCYIRYDANIPESLYHTEGDDYVEIVGKQETLVKKDRKDTTEGNNEEQVTGNRNVTIQGNADVTVKGKLTLKVGSCTVTPSTR